MTATVTNFKEAAERAVVLAEQSTRQSDTSLEREQKLAFMQVMRRWQAIFKRSDTGNVETDKWLLAEYYKSLGHLGQQGWDLLTEELKARCTFFPTIKECLEVINPGRFEYSSPFFGAKWLDRRDPDLLGSPAWHNAQRLENIKAKQLAGPDGGTQV